MKAVTEDRAKKQLATMLRSFTAGSVLHLLAEIVRESAEDARQAGDATAQEQFMLAHAALVVVGLGIDAIRPQ